MIKFNYAKVWELETPVHTIIKFHAKGWCPVEMEQATLKAG